MEPCPPVPMVHAPIGSVVPVNPAYPQIGTQQVPLAMPYPVNPPMPYPVNPPMPGSINPPATAPHPGFAAPIPQVNAPQINVQPINPPQINPPQINPPQINIQPINVQPTNNQQPMAMPMQGLQQPVMAQPVFVSTQPMKLEDPELKPGPFARPPGMPAPMVVFPRIG